MALQSPAKMLKLKLFKTELHALLSNVLDEVETLQTIAENPLVLDREWILDKMKEQIVRDEYVLEPRAVQTKEGLGNLYRLPRELRDMVYGHAICDGNMAILRASHQTYKEAGPLTFQKGIYRLAIGFGDRVVNPALSESLAKKIQNLQLRVNSRSSFIDGLEKHLPIVHMFDGSTIQRRNCVVTIECCPYHCDMDAFEVVHALEKLTGFERVLVELDLEWWGEPWPDTLYEDQKDQIWSRISGALDHDNEVLEPTLGTGDIGYDEEGLRLVFHPRK